MSMIRMSSENVKKRAAALLKIDMQKRGEKLEKWSHPQLHEIRERLQNLIHMSRVSEQYGSQENMLGHDAMVWIDVEDARALDFFK